MNKRDFVSSTRRPARGVPIRAPPPPSGASERLRSTLRQCSASSRVVTPERHTTEIEGVGTGGPAGRESHSSPPRVPRPVSSLERCRLRRVVVRRNRVGVHAWGERVVRRRRRIGSRGREIIGSRRARVSTTRKKRRLGRQGGVGHGADGREPGARPGRGVLRVRAPRRVREVFVRALELADAARERLSRARFRERDAAADARFLRRRASRGFRPGRVGGAGGRVRLSRTDGLPLARGVVREGAAVREGGAGLFSREPLLGFREEREEVERRERGVVRREDAVARGVVPVLRGLREVRGVARVVARGRRRGDARALARTAGGSRGGAAG